jgi:hypothetical protein
MVYGVSYYHKPGEIPMKKRVLLIVNAAMMFIAIGGCAGSTMPKKPIVDVSQLPAFPGAEGFGALTIGGRGGRVIEVTNLNDSGPGSFREACDANEPRIIVFRVGGNIELQKNIVIRRPFVTIAGQTAPGDGICLKNYALNINAREVVIRFIRVRPGDVAGKEMDSIGARSNDHIILDHVSASWSIDECISFTRNGKNTTVQNCIAAESLFQSVHSKGHHGFGGIWAPDTGSFHHNLLADHSSRNPRFAGSIAFDHRNNVIFNWGYNSAYGGENAHVNMVNNYYKPGPATRDNVRSRIVSPAITGRWYIEGNFVEGSPQVSADNWNGGVQTNEKTDLNTIRVKTPFDAPPVRTQSAKDAYEIVLRTAGCVLPRRDAVDLRVIEQVRTGKATAGKTFDGGGNGIIDSQDDVGGWPELKGGSAPLDTDHDGMPDTWEKNYGLNPGDPSDGPKDADGDGYTNVEECLNGTDPTKFVDYTMAANNVDSLVK